MMKLPKRGEFPQGRPARKSGPEAVLTAVDDEACEAFSKNGWACCRARGHSKDHVAVISPDRVYARWRRS